MRPIIPYPALEGCQPRQKSGDNCPLNPNFIGIGSRIAQPVAGPKVDIDRVYVPSQERSFKDYQGQQIQE